MMGRTKVGEVRGFVESSLGNFLLMVKMKPTTLGAALAVGVYMGALTLSHPGHLVRDGSRDHRSLAVLL
jgi:hypothetical protein